MTATRTEILVPGSSATGRALVLSAPISFWGGVDAKSGRIVDVRHPEHDAVIGGTILFLPGTIGSSSASAVLLELVHAGKAPAAVVMHEPDAILLLGLIVAREMRWACPIALRLDRREHGRFAGRLVSAASDGTLDIIAAAG